MGVRASLAAHWLLPLDDPITEPYGSSVFQAVLPSIVCTSIDSRQLFHAHIVLDIIVLCSLNNSHSAYSPVESQWRPNLNFHNKDVEHSLYVYWTFVLQLLRTAGSFRHSFTH